MSSMMLVALTPVSCHPSAIISLLGNPEASSPLNCDAGNLIRSNDILGFNSLAKMYTELLAIPPA